MVATGTPGAVPRVDADAVAEWLRVFLEPGQVTELRAIGYAGNGWGRPRTLAGWFDDPDALAAAALEVTHHAEGVYFIPNPLLPDLLARRCNRVGDAARDEQTRDEHVLARRWMLVDIDPSRPVAGISADDGEKGEAHRLARRVMAWARSEGWPDPVVADSGNGYHLLYPVDLPADDDGFVRGTLHALGDRFDSDAVKVDRGVFNPARVVKLYGTWARKGDSVPRLGRVHRQSRVLYVPAAGQAGAVA